MAVNIKKEFGNTRNRKPDLTTLIYGKVPPQAPDLEEAVLGACMLEKDTFQNIMGIIYSDNIFYVDAHQKIYEAMCYLFNSGSVVDLLTITEALRKAGNLEIVGGAYYLSKLTMSVLSGAHAETHARIVYEKYMQREVIRICGTAINDAYDDFSDAFGLIEGLETDIKDITAGIVGVDDITVADAYQSVISEYEAQKKSPSGLIGVPSGLVDLDEMTSGWCKPSLIFIGAQPSQGKTALMLAFCLNAAKLGRRSKIYSLETGAVNLTRRMAATVNKIPFAQLRAGALNAWQESALREGAKEFMKMKISITYKVFYIEDLERSARKEKKKNADLEFIAIDFIQLVKMRNPGKMDKFAIVGEVSRRLKVLSAELDIPIIALSQLNRAVNNKADKRPEKHNLANSSELEQNADVIVFIHYEDSGQKDEWGKSVLAPILIVDKNKDGKCGDVKIKFNADIQEWMNYSDFNQNVLPSSVSAGMYRDITESRKKETNEDVPF